MQSVIKKIFSYCVFADLPSDTYKTYRDEARTHNIECIKAFGYVSMLTGIILLFLHTFISTIKLDTVPYIILAAVGTLMTITASIILPKYPRAVFPALYISSYVLIFFCAGLGLKNETIPGTMICLILITVPCMMMDVPWKLSTLSFGTGTAFIICSYFIKEHGAFVYDLSNIIATLLINLYFIPHIQKYKYSELITEAELRRERDTDSLTHINNKSSSEKLITEYLSKPDSMQAAFMMIDIDNFKSINDTYGHAVGDQALTAISEVIADCCRKTDICGRFGGDEFIILLPGVENTMAAQKKAAELVESVRRKYITPFDNEGEMISLTVSVGISMFPTDGHTAEELLIAADKALYKVKNKGKNGYSMF